ncbi:MAG: enoyl-CoA hydratase/isomerase family protein [Myxococcota bacterium]
MLTRRAGAVLEAAIERPCIGVAELEALDALLGQVEADPSVRAVVFHSTAPVGFGTGVDLAALAVALGTRGVDDWIARAGAVFDRLESLPVLTVGALHGVTFGGALEWALCLDVLVAERGTRFALPELRLGLIPGFGGYGRLCRRSGESLARELLLTGRSIGTRRALDRGLVASVVPEDEALPAALAIAEGAAGIERAAMAAAKRLVQAGPSDVRVTERSVLADRLADPDTRDLILQTLERSDPWKHLPPSRT